MFCPRCGSENPETGKFCRSCGTDLGNVSAALSGVMSQPLQVLDHKGKPVSWDRAIVKIFTGLAFLAVSFALAITGMGRGWWFWMLIPAFTSLGAGVAQYMQLKKAEKGNMVVTPPRVENVLASHQREALPPVQTQFVAPESRYKTGDLAPASVTEETTRHLQMENDAETRTLPKV